METLKVVKEDMKIEKITLAGESISPSIPVEVTLITEKNAK